jgi:protein O-mannosyl-transferase
MSRVLLKYLICLLLAGITFAVFFGVAHCTFITLDDRVYVVANPPVQHGFSSSSVKWAFQTLHAGYWIPVTWLSHMLDCQLYGLNPAGHHVTNLIFHIANTVLLFILLQRLTARLWPSAFAALLFAIHPMHVESVTWVTERKDVLSAFFFLLTLLAYTRYTQLALRRAGQQVPVAAASLSKRHSRPAAVPSPLPLVAPVQTGGRGEGQGEARANSQSESRLLKSVYFVIALFFFTLGLMAKPMLVTLPFVLLLLDYWPLDRFSQSAIRLRQLAVEKLPFFLLAAFFSYVTFLAQRNAGAVKPTLEYSLAERLGHVPVSYVWYIFKLFWPAGLSIFYTFHQAAALGIAAASLLLLAVTVFALARARKSPFFLFGWLWFLGMLLPVIGLVQAGDQAYADRFSYLPYIGLFIIIAWGVPDLLAKIPFRSSVSISSSSDANLQLAAPKPGEGGSAPGVRQWVIGIAATLVSMACFARTIQEVQYWKDGPTLFKRALALYPDNDMAWALLGSEYELQGRADKALDCIKHALTLNRHFDLGWEYVGYLLAQKKDYAGAEKAYQTALSLMWYRGDRIDTYNRLGDAYAADQKYPQAAAAYQSSLALEAGQADVQTKLGQCFLKSQEPDQAQAAFQAAIDLQPDNPDALIGLGMISQSSGFSSDAVAEYGKALEADPDSLVALNNLAWLLATDSDPALRNGSQAVSLAEHACQLTHYKKAFMIGTLAAAYAEAGRFDDAVAAAQKAHDVALANGEKDLAARNTELLQLYKSHRPYRAETGRPNSKK